MPGFHRPLALVAALLLLLPAFAAAQSPREEILAADVRRFAAMIQGDLATLEGLLAEDLTYTHSNAQVETRAQLLESLRSGKLRYLAATPSDVEVRVYGESAVVTGRAEMKVSSQGRELAMVLRFTEVWVKSGGAWKLAAWQSTRVEAQ